MYSHYGIMSTIVNERKTTTPKHYNVLVCAEGWVLALKIPFWYRAIIFIYFFCTTITLCRFFWYTHCRVLLIFLTLRGNYQGTFSKKKRHLMKNSNKILILWQMISYIEIYKLTYIYTYTLCVHMSVL